MKEERLWNLVIIVVLVLASTVDLVVGKRAFAIRMRSKSNANTGSGVVRGRKNYQQAHMADNVSGGMVRNPPVPDQQPSRAVGWSGDHGGGPIGPPPAYPGLGHHAVPVGGAPPAYARINPPSYAEAMGYSSHGHGYGGVGTPGRHYDYSTNYNNLHSAYGDNNIGSYGSSYGYHRASNPFSVGNVLTGVALWQLGHGLAHSHHHHHYDPYHDSDHYHHHQHSSEHLEEPTGPTAPAEFENSHIQVNADFDFGPTARAADPTLRSSSTEHSTVAAPVGPSV